MHSAEDGRMMNSPTMRSTASASLLFAVATLQGAAAAANNGHAGAAQQPPPRRRLRVPYLRPEDLESLIPGDDGAAAKRAFAENNWVSQSEDVQFLPLLNRQPKGAAPNNRKLQSESTTTGAHDKKDPYSVQPFISGMGDYDENAQAWRLLGFVVDCNEVNDLGDDYVESGGSGDAGTQEGCGRYLLWAAYVDTEYQGCGIGEYQYWDIENERWDDTACQYAQQGGGSGDQGGGESCSSRCAKMDCHLEDTHFSVLGFFKHGNYDDWMEQLFKHEGICVWSDEQYAFMQDARKAWPGGCVDSGKADASGSPLYYNIKPMKNGRIAVGLYTDEYCLTESPEGSDTDTVESILGNFFQGGSGGSGDNYNYDFSGDTLAESMERWDSAFSVWNYCHPCVAYDIENTDGSKYYNSCYDDDGAQYQDDQYNYNQRKKDRELGGEYCGKGQVFECYDNAGYTNVNQCMKFSAKTVMKTATFRDLSMGGTQGTLAEYPLSGFIDSSKKHQRKTLSNAFTWIFLVASACALLYSLWNLHKASRDKKLMPTLRSSLLGDDHGDSTVADTAASPATSPSKVQLL